MEGEASKQKSKQYLRAWLRQPVLPYLAATVATLVTFLQSEFDPLRLVSTSGYFSSQLVSTLLSPFYGGKNHVGREQIVVVLYDESYLKGTESDWPIGLDQHLMLLETIAAANPAAIFLDVYFTAPNKQRKVELKEFYSELKDIDCSHEYTASQCKEYGKAPFVLASLMAGSHFETCDENGVRTALTELSERSYLYKLEETVESKCTDKNKEESVELSVETNLKDNTRNKVTQESAAYALYLQWCDRQGYLQRQHSSNKPVLDKPICPLFSTKDKKQTLYLQWGYGPSQQMVEFSKITSPELIGEEEVCEPSPQGMDAAFKSVKLFFQSVIGIHSHKQKLCPYHTNISALYVLRARMHELRELMENKVVLVGTARLAVKNEVESHVHGFLPGIFWHAAAVDNLIQRGDKFYRTMPEAIIWGGRIWGLDKILEALVASILFFAMAYFIHQNRVTLEPWGMDEMALNGVQKKIYHRLQISIAVFITTLLPFLVCLVWLLNNYSTANWLGTLMLIGLLNSGGQAICLRRLNLHAASRAFSLWRIKVGFNLLTQSFVKTLKMTIFVLMLLMFLPVLITAGLLLFLIPVVYFAVEVRSGHEYIIFSIMYLSIIVFSAKAWWSSTKKLRQMACQSTEKESNKQLNKI